MPRETRRAGSGLFCFVLLIWVFLPAAAGRGERGGCRGQAARQLLSGGRRVESLTHLPEPPPASAKPVEQFLPPRCQGGRADGRKRAASKQVCPFLPADVWLPQMMAGNKTAPSVRRQPGKTGRVRGEGCIPGCRGRGRLIHREVPARV